MFSIRKKLEGNSKIPKDDLVRSEFSWVDTSLNTRHNFPILRNPIHVLLPLSNRPVDNQLWLNHSSIWHVFNFTQICIFQINFFHEKYIPIVTIDISAEQIIITANSNGRAEKIVSSIIMFQISKRKETKEISAYACLSNDGTWSYHQPPSLRACLGVGLEPWRIRRIRPWLRFTTLWP